MKKDITSFKNFSSFFQEQLANEMFPDLLYITPDILNLQQAQQLFKNRFKPCMKTWNEFIENEALSSLRKGENLLNPQLQRFFINETLETTEDND